MTLDPADPDERPELFRLNRDVLLVQSWETFAMRDPTELDRSLEMIVFSGRWNKREETGTFSVIIEEAELPLLIEGLQRGLRTMKEAST